MSAERVGVDGDRDDRSVDAPAAPASGAVPWHRRHRTAIVAGLLLVGFAVTRLLPIALTLDPSLYPPVFGPVSDPTGDLGLYGSWATQIVGDGLVPYRDVDIEYPPGSLPFVLVPALLGQATFSVGVFVGLMVLLDLAALLALLALGHRGGSFVGALAWVLLPPALGVLLYARLDLVPAVALLLALERAHARRWTTSGIWLGLGAAAKLVPALALPLLLLAAAGRRLRLLAGVAVGAVVAWLPFATDTGELITDVLGYHNARGIHLESTWGAVLNLRRIAGGPQELVYEYGAFHITGPSAPGMLALTTTVSIAIVVAATGIGAVRWWGRPDRARVELPLAVTAMLALLLATGRVLSPQFMVWLLAAAAVMLAVTPRLWWWALPLLAALVTLTAAGYPIGFDALRAGAPVPALLLLWRNVLLCVLGLLLVARWLWGGDARAALARPRGFVDAPPPAATVGERGPAAG